MFSLSIAELAAINCIGLSCIARQHFRVDTYDFVRASNASLLWPSLFIKREKCGARTMKAFASAPSWALGGRIPAAVSTKQGNKYVHCLTLLQTIQVEKPELSWVCRVWQHLMVSLSPRLARCRQIAAAPADHPQTPHLALKRLA
jgi:hypothetical protein